MPKTFISFLELTPYFLYTLASRFGLELENIHMIRLGSHIWVKYNFVKKVCPQLLIYDSTGQNDEKELWGLAKR